MRKFTFLIAALFMVVVASAQQPATPSNLHQLVQPLSNFSKFKSTPFRAPGSENDLSTQQWKSSTSSVRDEETIIGTSIFDYQTNGSISTRLLNNGDGTISAGWVTLCEGGNAATDRGTGYNYFDGTSWLPSDCHRVEPNDRTGYACMGLTGSNKEVILAHSSTAVGMILTTRQKGTGPWTEDVDVLGHYTNDTWARLAVGGTDGKTLHAIWNPSGVSTTFKMCGQISPVVYSRSTDDGATWPILRQCNSLIDSSSYLGFGAEDYAIAAQGNNVAILITNSAADVILLKSTDNGDTWTKTILWQFPIPFYDPATTLLDVDDDGAQDVIAAPGSDGRVEYDNNGMIHVAFTRTLVTSDGTGLSYYPQLDGGLYYWNESMFESEPVLIDSARDYNGDGIINTPVDDPSGNHFGAGSYGQGLTMQPTIGFDASNRVYITYASYDELADTTAYLCGHRHTYVITSYDQGATWTFPYDIVPTAAEGGDGENQEAVYGDMARNVDDYVHVIYQRDPAPGQATLGTADEKIWNTYVNDIVYDKVQLGELTGTSNIHVSNFSVSQNTPNPFNDQTQFSIVLQKQSNVNLKVTNVLGQVVYSENTNYSAGNHVYNFNRGNLSAGIYNFTVNADGEKITKKIIIE